MSLATRLKELRIRSNKSLQEVADEVGASKAHIWDLESNRAKNPSIELLKALSRCFGVGVAELIGENPESDDDKKDLVVMYRDLKELSDQDRDAIKSMMDHLRKRNGQKDGA